MQKLIYNSSGCQTIKRREGVSAGSAYPEKGQKSTSQLLSMLRRPTLGHMEALLLVSQKT